MALRPSVPGKWEDVIAKFLFSSKGKGVGFTVSNGWFKGMFRKSFLGEGFRLGKQSKTGGHVNLQNSSDIVPFM